MAENSSIIICDQRVDVGRRVITFQDDPTIDAHTQHCITRPDIFPFSPAKGLPKSATRFRSRRLMGSDRSLGRLKQILRQFVVHHDGLGNSRDCFKVLHDERGLSVHFLIDNNGDIYQTLDMVDCGFQAAGVNEISVGVELCSRGDVLLDPNYYAKHGIQRDKVTCTINGHQWLAWDYTKDQYDSMVALGRTLARVFPDLPRVFPQGTGGEAAWGTLDGDVRAYAGYLGHYHITNQKWDPGPWDFKRFIQQIHGRTFYPIIPGKEKAEIGEEPGKLEEAQKALYDNNEQEADGGFFPVGPIGQSRLWHGGLHLMADRGTPLYAPFEGKVIAARRIKEDDWGNVGSTNFVLIRHEMAVGGQNIQFHTLLFHLDDDTDESKQPGWMKKHAKDLDGGDVVTMEETVGAGDVVGHFGEAGPPGKHVGQVHFEIFSVEEIGEKVEPGYWKTFDGTKDLDPKAGPRFCAIPEINQPIDANKNKFLAASEIKTFFHDNPARDEFHKLAVRHVSEWGDNNDYEAALNKAPDFAALPRPKKHQMFADQIEPTLWWKDELSSIGLPDDKIVWSYHPVTFIAWVTEKLRGPAQQAVAIKGEKDFGGKAPPPDIKDDALAEGGFVDDEDALFGDAAKNLDLEKLSEGYPEQDKK